VTNELQLVVVVVVVMMMMIELVKSDLEGQMRHTGEKKEREEDGIKEDIKEITEVQWTFTVVLK